MKQIRVLRKVFIFCAVLLWLLPSVAAFQVSDRANAARQMAAIANDNAVNKDKREEALRQLAEALHLFVDAGEEVDAARVLNRMGRLQFFLNKPHDAIHSHRKAIALLKNRSAADVEVDNLNGLAAAYMLVDNKHQATEVLQRALMLSERVGYIPGKAQALLTLSDRQNHDNHAVALETAQKALKLWEALNDKIGLAHSYSKVGTYYLAQNMLLEATQNYQQALALSHELNNPAEEAEALIMLGFIEHRKGDWQRSIAYLTQAQGLLDEKSEPEKMGQIAAGLAEAFNENGLPEIGLAHYQRALGYYSLTQDPTAVTYATWGLGCTYYLLQNYPEALIHLQKARARVSPDSLYAASSEEYLGRVYLATGEYPAALRSLESAFHTYSRIINPREAARVLALMGQVYAQQGAVNAAKESHQQALETFRAMSDHINESATLYALGNLELEQNNLVLAEDYLRQSIAATENIRRVSSSSDLTAAFSATVHDRYESYIECLMRQHHARSATGLDVKAFELSEQARARSLTELLHATQTNLTPGLEPRLAEQEKSLRQSLRVKEDSKVALLARAYKKEELEASERELARLSEDYETVREQIGARYPAYDKITRPTRWTLQDIQNQVIADDETLLLEYSLGAYRSFVWAVTRDRIETYELPAQAQIVQAARTVHRLLAKPPDPTTREEQIRATAELGRMILSPLAAELTKRRIIVVADGALNYIPFQVLSAPPDALPLVASFEVINAPSASILGELRKEASQRRPAKILAAFGDPVFSSNYAQRKDPKSGNQLAQLRMADNAWHGVLRDIELNGDSFDPAIIKPLFYAKRELANLRDATAGAEALVASDYSATRENLLSADLTQYSILHFATHGFLDPKRPENSGLVLSTVDSEGKEINGFVGLQDIYQLRAPVDLVVLSACQTGLGKDVRGEGLLSLTRGFMYAGASSVVASLWKVDDEATAELMKQFYGNMLQKGMTPGAALREAQNSIRQKTEWSSPYYWAAFTLQGEHRQIIKPAGFRQTYVRTIVGGALLTFLVIAVGWYFRRLRVRRVQRYSTVKK